MVFGVRSVKRALLRVGGRCSNSAALVGRGFCERLIVLEVASRARFDNHVYDVMGFGLHVGIVCNLSGHMKDCVRHGKVLAKRLEQCLLL